MSQKPTKNKALIVEDNPINVKLACSMLERLGLETYCALNGKEAIQKVEDGLEVNIIFMDLQMPIMDGIETTSYMNESIQGCPPIVAMTANSSEKYFAECKEAGMSDFIEKPIRLNRLKEVLLTHLPTLLLQNDQNYWRELTHDNSEYSHIHVSNIEENFSECWDIFYKFFRDFIEYYQYDLSKLERAIKHLQRENTLHEIKQLRDLSSYFAPLNLKGLLDTMTKQVGNEDFTSALTTFREIKNEAQAMIREVSQLLNNATQILKQ